MGLYDHLQSPAESLAASHLVDFVQSIFPPWFGDKHILTKLNSAIIAISAGAHKEALRILGAASELACAPVTPPPENSHQTIFAIGDLGAHPSGYECARRQRARILLACRIASALIIAEAKNG